MKDIKFLGADGDFLLLETAEGVRYRLLIDETVRRASRGDAQSQLDAPTLSPVRFKKRSELAEASRTLLRPAELPKSTFANSPNRFSMS